MDLTSHIQAHLSPYKKLLLAVSGGVDSMALMHVCVAAFSAEAPERLHIATVDHGLRADSATDAAFVASEAAKLGLNCAILHWQGAKPKTGIQAQARAARYALLEAEATRVQADAIVLAHTKDDQIETVLMRFLHGSGLAGLAGINAVFMNKNAHKCTLLRIRPLLEVSKHQIIEYMRENKFLWREDPSNQNTNFERVKLRKLLPQLEKLGLDTNKIYQLSQRAKRFNDLNQWVIQQNTHIVVQKNTSTFQLNFLEWKNLPEETKIQFIIQGISNFFEGQISLEKTEKITQKLTAKENTFKANICNVLIEKKNDIIYFSPEPKRRKITTKI